MESAWEKYVSLKDEAERLRLREIELNHEARELLPGILEEACPLKPGDLVGKIINFEPKFGFVMRLTNCLQLEICMATRKGLPHEKPGYSVGSYRIFSADSDYKEEDGLGHWENTAIRLKNLGKLRLLTAEEAKDPQAVVEAMRTFRKEFKEGLHE